MANEYLKRSIGHKYDIWKTELKNAWGDGSKTGWQCSVHGGLTSSLMPYAGWKLQGVVTIKSVK